MGFIARWLIIVSAFGGFIYYMNAKRDDLETRAQIQLAPYNAQIDRLLRKTSYTQHRSPAKGRVIFVDEKTKRVDKFSDYTISPNNLPNRPDDVDSVVLHNCDYVQVGSYSNGSKAMQQTCNFTVIDVASGHWNDWGIFKGSMPPEEIKRKRGSSSDERGGRAVYMFLNAGGLAKG